jgi:thiamine pyrophosphokinase
MYLHLAYFALFLSPLRPSMSDYCILESPLVSKHTDWAFILLNAPLLPDSRLFTTLWNKSTIHICADGGANRLRQAFPNLTPTLICGDLDSLHDDTRAYYQNVRIERYPSQDTNDLDKALSAAAAFLTTTSSRRRAIVFGAFGGRLDQEMASFQALFKYKNSNTFDELWLYNDRTCAVLLDAGKYLLRVQLPVQEEDSTGSIVGEGPTCGLIPLGGSVESVTTRGFKWDLNDQRTEFGGLVSTSNHMESADVEIETSGTLLFTAETWCGSNTHRHW